MGMHSFRGAGIVLFSTLFAILAAAGTATAPSGPQSVVTPGTERIVENGVFDSIRGKRIAVLAHHASRTRDGTHLVDLLARRKDTSLRMIFAPEHGYRSVDDDLLPDSSDPVTGLPVYSLYGPRKAPTPQMLAQLDAIVVDLQDVGIRFYTYAATVVYTMQAAKRAGVKVILLDRPNPIGAAVVEGAVLDATLANGGLTTLAQIPTRHGMTMGELARYYNSTLAIGADLTVVPMLGYQRGMLWTDTGLPWRPSSPALVTAEQALLYSAFGAFESLDLAVGRGIDNSNAFHLYGSPYVSAAQAKALAAKLSALGLPGLRFGVAQWRPDRATFVGKLCRGFRVDVTDVHRVEPFRAMLEVGSVMKTVLGSLIRFLDSEDELGAQWLAHDLDTGAPVQGMIDGANAELPGFLKRRSAALVY